MVPSPIGRRNPLSLMRRTGRRATRSRAALSRARSGRRPDLGAEQFQLERPTLVRRGCFQVLDQLRDTHPLIRHGPPSILEVGQTTGVIKGEEGEIRFARPPPRGCNAVAATPGLSGLSPLVVGSLQSSWSR